MTYSDTSRRTGAAVNRRTAKRDPYAVYCQMRGEDHTASLGVMRRKWRAALAGDDDLQDAVNEYALTNFNTHYDKERAKPTPRRKTAKEIQKEKAAIAAVVNEARNVILMDLKMPNGKKLKDCTFAEVSKCGGWFRLLAMRGKPGEIVGERLTEEDLRKMK